MGLEDLLRHLESEMNLPDGFREASDHAFGCRCDICKQWWVQMPPDYDEITDEWTFGPFSQDEMIAAGKVIPSQRPSEYFKEYDEDSSGKS